LPAVGSVVASSEIVSSGSEPGREPGVGSSALAFMSCSFTSVLVRCARRRPARSGRPPAGRSPVR
jgi:hypothetical protein